MPGVLEIRSWHGLKQWEQAIARKVERSDLSARVAVEEAAGLVQKLAQARAPHQTGRLAASVVFDPPVKVGAGWHTQIGVSALANYGRLVELGLRGTRHQPTHFFADAYTEASSQFGRIYQRAFARDLFGG